MLAGRSSLVNQVYAAVILILALCLVALMARLFGIL